VKHLCDKKAIFTGGGVDSFQFDDGTCCGDAFYEKGIAAQEFGELLVCG
jgi:hypothetical protein